MKQRIIFPPEHESEPDQEHPGQKRRRFRRRQRFTLSWQMIPIGLVMGIIAGLFYAWFIAPQNVSSPAPDKLRYDDKVAYVVAVIMSHSQENNLTDTVERLIQLDLGNNPINTVAEMACDLARSGYVDNSSGVRAVQYMKVFYQGQGRSGCADNLIADIPRNDDQNQVDTDPDTTPIPTSILPSKTPVNTPSPTRIATSVATPEEEIVERIFEGRVVGTYCDVARSGLIEIEVKTFGGIGVPGEKLRVRWDNGSDTFFTGLKPEYGDAYADFQMEAGKSYTIDMPNLSESLRATILADACFTTGGEEAITSYRVQFVRIQ